MNRLILSNSTHQYQEPGVVFAFSLAEYLKAEVTIPVLESPKKNRYTFTELSRRRVALNVLKKRIEAWGKIFEKLGNDAPTPQLAARSGIEIRSVSKSLNNIMDRTSYVGVRVPSPEDIERYQIPYNNRQGCMIWHWYPEGKINKSEEVDNDYPS